MLNLFPFFRDSWNENPRYVLTISGSFGCECERILIFDQSLLVLSLSGDLAVHTLQGTIKQSLRCDSQVLCVDMNDRYVSVATASAYLYVWDMSRRYSCYSLTKYLKEKISDYFKAMKQLLH
jgi:hypothetical protein